MLNSMKFALYLSFLWKFPWELSFYFPCKPIDKKVAPLVKELTSLKSEGGTLEGGTHQETYNHKLLKKIAKKAQKKEDKKKMKLAKDTKKWLGIQKMIATKKANKDKAAAEAEAKTGPADG